MTFIFWLYQFIGAVFLGFMICSGHPEDTQRRPTLVEWFLIVGLAIVWPYAFWLIYKQEVKS